MRQHLTAPGCLLLVEGQPWRGVLWGRRGEFGTTLDALLVLPEQRRQGVASRLLGRFRKELDGCDWRFGGGDHHFVPGLPDGSSHGHEFFLSQELMPDWHAHDLLWEAPLPGPTSWDETVYRLISAEEADSLSRLLELFGKRWRSDTTARLSAMSGGSQEEIMGAYLEGRLVGFCHIWSDLSSRLGPSTFWLDRRDDRWGGVGPLGVHPDCRGLGLGAGVVESSMAYLRRRGKQRIGVDWTGLPEFYERCGFRRWLSYRGYRPGG